MSISAIGSGWGSNASYAMQRAYSSQGKQLSGADFASLVIQQKDQDGDGAIGASESGLSSTLFDKLDLDSDGLLTSTELQTTYENRQGGMGGRMGGMQGPPPPPPSGSDMASEILAREDANGDGVISSDEAHIDSTRFGEIDANGDGNISLDELQNSDAQGAGSKSGESTAGAQSAAFDFSSLLDVLNQNTGAKSYSSQDWISGMLESLAKNVSISA